jgi:predicted transcriptional regulator
MPGVSNYDPYAPNAEGFTEALIDLKATMAGRTVYAVAGFQAIAFEDIAQGQAVYSRMSDGKVGLAIANDTEDKATVAGFAETSKLTGEIVRVLIVGLLPTTGLSPGEIYYLSAVSAGSITTTPPSTAGYYVTRVGEAAASSQLIVQLEPPIQLS